MGIRCSINNNLALEFDALFDTGASYACLKPELMDKISKQFQMLDTPPGYPPLYIVPITIHLDSHSLSRYCMVYDGDENLIPPRIFIGEYSINFTQINKKNFVTFNPKPKQPTIGEINLNYKTLFNKETWMTMPNGTPGFYFSIGGNIETALFDTGSLFNVIEPATADKIEIERYPSAKPLDLDIPGLPSDHLDIQGYLVPIALPKAVSFTAPVYVYDESPMNAMNIISAAQFLDNGIRFTLNQYSASFSNLGGKQRKQSWIVRT
jgi:hypothetical protein